jgi:hypothetical protein
MHLEIMQWKCAERNYYGERASEIKLSMREEVTRAKFMMEAKARFSTPHSEKNALVACDVSQEVKMS